MKHISSFDEIILKFRVLFVPFLIRTIGIIAAYTFFNWLLTIKLDLFQIPEKFTDLVLPILLCIAFVSMGLSYKKIFLCKITERENSGAYSQFWDIIAYATLTLSIIFAQLYLHQSTAKAMKIETSAQLDRLHLEKYYQIHSMYLDKKYTTVYFSAEPGRGRHNKSLNFTAYYALPLMSAQSDTSLKTQNVWYVKTYSKTVSNSMSKTEKEIAYANFRKDADQQFAHADLYNVGYFVRGDWALDGCLSAIDQTKRFEYTKYPIILYPNSAPFNPDYNGKLHIFLLSFCLGSFLMFLMIVLRPLSEETLKVFETK